MKVKAADQQTEVLTLCVADQKHFADVLIRPAKPNAALRFAVKHHKQMIGDNTYRVTAFNAAYW